jgi:hypothetical protein
MRLREYVGWVLIATVLFAAWVTWVVSLPWRFP